MKRDDFESFTEDDFDSLESSPDKKWVNLGLLCGEGSYKEVYFALHLDDKEHLYIWNQCKDDKDIEKEIYIMRAFDNPYILQFFILLNGMISWFYYRICEWRNYRR